VTDAARLLAALRLASPALPIGGFSYSQGLESAIERGWVHDADSARRWIGDCLSMNIGRFEAPLVQALCRAALAGDWTEATRLDELYVASRETRELRAETLQMGFSLLRILRGLVSGDDASLRRVSELDDDGSREFSLPCAWALAGKVFGMPAADSATAYLWAWLENQVMVTMKAVPLGQQAGQSVLSALLPALERTVEASGSLAEDEWSNFAPGFVLASSWHETQYSRMFRS
jgi:urease accessory protein